MFSIFKKKNPLEKYPLKKARMYGKTFDEWRTANGYSLEPRSVPDNELFRYCIDCGWPEKGEWKKIRGFEGIGSGLPTPEYAIWLKFIGVMPEPEEMKRVSNRAEIYLNLPKRNY